MSGATYTVLPLVSLGDDANSQPQYLPINVKDSQGKTLTFSVPDQTTTNNTNNQDSGANGPTETITITKKTTGATQAPAPTPKGTPPTP